MSRTLRFFFATLVTLVVAGSATSAFGAPAAWQSVNVTLHTDDKQSVMLVSGELPSTAKLPQEGELAVPAGTQLQWIGEILGGPGSEDPALTYVKSTANGMDVYRFTLTKSRTAQVEGVVPGVSVFDGTNYAMSLKWTAWRALPEVHISARVPQGVQITQPAPGATLQPADASFGYYTKTVTAPKAGDVLDLAFSYAIPAGSAAAGATATSNSDTTALLIVLAVFVGGLVILGFAVRHRMAAKAAASEVGQSSGAGGPAPRAQTASESPLEEPESAEPRPAKRAKPALAIFAIVGVLVVGVAVAVGLATSTPVVNGKITKFFGAASPCTSASIPIVANPGVDLTKQGVQLVDAFAGQKQVGDVTLDIARSTVDVTFCESAQSEASMRKILVDTGLVSVGAAPAVSAPATVSPVPSGQ